MGGLGLRPSSAWYVYKGNTPVVNSLLSMRYLLSKEDGYQNPLYPLVAEENGIRVYENPYVLPLGFMADEAILDWNPSYTNASKAFEQQNDFLRLATGGAQQASAQGSARSAVDSVSAQAVMETAPFEEKSVENAAAITKIGSPSPEDGKYTGGAFHIEVDDKSKPGYAKYIFKNPDGRPLYLYVKSRQVDYAWFIKGNKSEGHSPKYYPYVIDTQYFGNAGTEAAASEPELGPGYSGDVELSLKFEENKSGDYEIYGAYFNEAPFREAFGELASRPLEIDSFGDSRIAGRVDAGGSGGILMTTIPFDKGWRARVDGEQAETLTLGGGFLALRLGAGRHSVELDFEPPLFRAGLAVSLASAAIVIVLIVIRKGRPGAAGSLHWASLHADGRGPTVPTKTA
jgi:hypothetical protein